MVRRNAGEETWFNLREWTKGSTRAERLAAQILLGNGFKSVDPSHPLGGPDQSKDIICLKENEIWRVAVYFPKGQKSFTQIKKKFEKDFLGNTEYLNFVFVTNQELKLDERSQLSKIVGDKKLEIYHLETISALLNSVEFYGVRLDFLDIDMTREEQISFFARLQADNSNNAQILQKLERLLESDVFQEKVKNGVPLQELKEYKELLDKINRPSSYVYDYLNFGQQRSNNLNVPLNELREFKKLLDEINYPNDPYYGFKTLSFMRTPALLLKVPLQELKEFSELLKRISGKLNYGMPSFNESTMADLKVPLSQLQQFSNELNQTIQRVKNLKTLTTSLKT